MPGVNYYDGSTFQEVAAVQQADGSTAPVYRYDGSQWVQIYPTESAPASGVSRYEFEQSVSDSWDGNDGTDNTSAGYSTDAQVGSYSKDFDGADDTVPIGNAVVGDLSTLSITMYVKPPMDAARYMYTEGDASADDDFVAIRSGPSANELQGIISGSGDNTIVGSAASANTWYHVALTVDVGTEAVLYFDGSQVDSATESSPFDNTNIDQAGFGALFRSSIGNYFGGLIDDARIYDKVLSSTEVSNLYNNGSIN